MYGILWWNIHPHYTTAPPAPSPPKSFTQALWILDYLLIFCGLSKDYRLSIDYLRIIDYPLIIHRLSMDYLWIIYGLSMDYLWTIYRSILFLAPSLPKGFTQASRICTAPPAPSLPKGFTQASRICDLVEHLVEYGWNVYGMSWDIYEMSKDIYGISMESYSISMEYLWNCNGVSMDYHGMCWEVGHQLLVPLMVLVKKTMKHRMD